MKRVNNGMIIGSLMVTMLIGCGSGEDVAEVVDEKTPMPKLSTPTVGTGNERVEETTPRQESSELTQQESVAATKEQEESIAAIENLGGAVALEPVINVYFDQTTEITDGDLKHVGALTELQQLNLTQCSKVTDAGLAHLSGLTKLRILGLSPAQITDAGLAHLSGLTSLQALHLDTPQVTDAGLAQLEGMTGLRRLTLGPEITDAGLANLEGLTGLQRLVLDHSTKVTDAGVERLRAALPKCQIFH